jgi:hypothetical protein
VWVSEPRLPSQGYKPWQARPVPERGGTKAFDPAPSRRRVRVALLLLLALPLAHAQIDLRVPTEFELKDAALLSGHLQAPGLTLGNMSVVEPTRVTFQGGNLTVCPLTAPRSGLVPALLLLGADCAGGETFDSTQLDFGSGSRLLAAGTMPVRALPDAAVTVVFTRNDTMAMLLGQGGLEVSRPDSHFRFAATHAGTSVQVHSQTGPRYFNGTGFAFLHGGLTARWSALGVAADSNNPPLIVTAAGPEAVASAFHPATLLDLQEERRGPDAREARGNLTDILGGFGRVPAFVDGAILGRLDGTLAGHEVSDGVVLLRADRIEVQRHGDHLQGRATPRILLTPDGVAFSGGRLHEAPWLVGIVLWLLAAVALAARRVPPSRRWPHRVLWAAAAAVAFLLIDLAMVAGSLGTSALQSLGQRGGLALAVFEAAAIVLAFAFVALPVRVALGRLMPARLLLASEAGWAGLWLVALLVFRPQVFAWAYDVARF